MLTVNRSDLEKVVSGEATFDALLADGRATTVGDLTILGRLGVLMVEFDPRSEIMPGTKLRTEFASQEPFEGDIGAGIPEWAAAVIAMMTGWLKSAGLSLCGTLVDRDFSDGVLGALGGRTSTRPARGAC